MSNDVTFEHEGTSYTIPAPAEWSLDAIEAFEDEKIVTLVREVLGAAQWKAYKAEKRRTASDLESLFGSIEKALDSGN